MESPNTEHLELHEDFVVEIRDPLLIETYRQRANQYFNDLRSVVYQVLE